MPFYRGTRYPLLGNAARTYADKMLGYTPIAYWPLWEPSGSVATDISGNGYNGTYTGVTLGQTGIGDNRTCPYFDTADYANLHSAGLAAAINGNEGAVLIWFKVNDVSVWTDGVDRNLWWMVSDATEYIQIGKVAANNTLGFWFRSGAVAKTRTTTFSGTGWHCAGLRWSATEDTLMAFLDGVQVGATITGLGVWAGAITNEIIGAISFAPAAPWHGWIAHCALWASALSVGTLQSVMRSF